MATWCVAYTKSRQEKALIQDLDVRGIECYLPVVQSVRVLRAAQDSVLVALVSRVRVPVRKQGRPDRRGPDASRGCGSSLLRTRRSCGGNSIRLDSHWKVEGIFNLHRCCWRASRSKLRAARSAGVRGVVASMSDTPRVVTERRPHRSRGCSRDRAGSAPAHFLRPPLGRKTALATSVSACAPLTIAELLTFAGLVYCSRTCQQVRLFPSSIPSATVARFGRLQPSFGPPDTRAGEVPFSWGIS